MDRQKTEEEGGHQLKEEATPIKIEVQSFLFCTANTFLRV